MKKLYLAIVGLLLLAAYFIFYSRVLNSDNCFNSYFVKDHKLHAKYCPKSVTHRKFMVDYFSIIVPGNLFRIDNSPTEFSLIAKKEDDPGRPSEYEIDIFLDSQFQCLNPLHFWVEEPDPIITNIGDAWWGKSVKATEGSGFYQCQVADPMTVSYIFCAENNDKQVVICMRQVTDDSKRAKKIFSTFRWNE